MNLARTLRTLAIAVVIAAALASGAKAYTTYSSWGTLNVSFYVNPANLDVSQNAALSALQAGMRVWNEQSGTGFRFNYAGQVSTTTTGYDDKNMIVFRNDRDGSKIASTYSWTSNGLLKDTDIVFWDAARTFFTGTSGCTSGGAYIEDIAAHELGHALGLQHSSVADATMYGTYPSCSQGMRTLSADDIAAVQALYAEGPGEADTPPSVSVLSPDNGATVTASTTITFSGSATDTTDGDISGDLTWRSNISGHIGSGASFSRTLPAGSHTISATVTDSIGFTITRAIVLTVTSGAANTAPSVTISSPASGGTVAAGTLVTFRGSASDTQDGSLTSSLEWRSNLDGPIGTGGSFTRALTAGTHTLTASVTDSGGLTTSRFITVHSTAPAPPPPPPTPPPAPPTTPPAPTPPPTPPPAVPPPSPTVGTLTVTGHTAGANRKAVLSWGGLTATSVDIYRNGMKVRTTENDGVMTDQINGLVKGSYNYKVCVTGTSTCTSQATVTF